MSEDAILEFWRWWPEAAPRIAQAIAEGGWGELSAEIAARVHTIHPGLEWEVGPGEVAAHHFCLSSGRDPSLRRLTELWLSHAPGAGEGWEFAPARRAQPGAPVELEGIALEGEGVRVAFTTDVFQERIHLTLHHPALAQAPEAVRLTAATLFIERELGEDAVGRWIGEVTVRAEEPAGATSWAALRAALEALRGQATGARFIQLRGEDGEGWPVLATCNVAIKALDHLDLDLYVAVEIPLREADARGLATADEAKRLRALEASLLSEADEGVVFVGRETYRGSRTLHLHVAESSAALLAIERWQERHADEGVEVGVHADPRWNILRRWL